MTVTAEYGGDNLPGRAGSGVGSARAAGAQGQAGTGGAGGTDSRVQRGQRYRQRRWPRWRHGSSASDRPGAARNHGVAPVAPEVVSAEQVPPGGPPAAVAGSVRLFLFFLSFFFFFFFQQQQQHSRFEPDQLETKSPDHSTATSRTRRPGAAKVIRTSALTNSNKCSRLQPALFRDVKVSATTFFRLELSLQQFR